MVRGSIFGSQIGQKSIVKSKMAPRTLQDGPKTPQDGPKRLQDGPRRPQDGSKTAPRRPKTAPRWPQDGPQKTLRRPNIPKMPPPRVFSPRAVPPSPPRFSGHGPMGYPPSPLIFDRCLAIFRWVWGRFFWDFGCIFCIFF